MSSRKACHTDANLSIKPKISMSKQRLTVTLSPSTLKGLDRLIDGKQLRSRSHAIDSILQQHLLPSINQAVILAGGKKMNDSQFPPLFNYHNQPLLVHLLDLLIKQSIEQIFVVTTKRGAQLLTPVLDHYLKTNIKVIVEPSPQGTAGALRLVRPILDHTFFCFHADIFTNIDLNAMAAFHFANQGIATIGVKPKVSQGSFNSVSTQGSQVTAFKPTNKEVTVSLVNSGIYIFEPAIFSVIPPTGTQMLEETVFPKLVQQRALYAYSFSEDWLDITLEPPANNHNQQKFIN